MGKLVSKTAIRKNKSSYSVDQMIGWYISDLDEYAPNITDDMKKYRTEIAKQGNEASTKLSLAIMKHCAFVSKNEKAREMLTSRYVGLAAANIVKTKNAKSIYDLVNFLVDLKHDDERFVNMEIDFEKYSKAIAETKDLKYNRYWIESFEEYDANFELLLNSNDAESSLFLANMFSLSKEDFKKCEDVVLKAKNAELSQAFYEIDGSNKAKHRKNIIDSKNSLVNSSFLIDKKCTTKQINEHKAAIYTSSDSNKLKALVCALSANSSLFSETEINEIVKNVVKTRNTKLARNLLLNDSLSVNLKAKLEKLILNSKDKSAIHTLTNVRFNEEIRQKAKEREKELSVSI